MPKGHRPNGPMPLTGAVASVRLGVSDFVLRARGRVAHGLGGAGSTLPLKHGGGSAEFNHRRDRQSTAQPGSRPTNR
jgi:hypothetical protein